MIIVRAVLVLAVIVIAVRSMGCAESLFYFPSREPFETPPGVRDVSFKADDGLTLHAWLLLPRGASAEHPVPAVLHVHGNAGNVSGHAAFSEYLPESGIAVLVFDYRSYGRSEVGKLRRELLLEDSRAALAFLRAQPEIDTDHLGVLGVSLGCCFAAELAAAYPELKSVCLVAPFESWRSIANQQMPVIGGLLILAGIDPVQSVTRLGPRPLLVVQGSADTIVPPRNAEAVVVAAKGAGVNATLSMVPGAGHNDIIVDEPVGRGLVTDFFRRTLTK